MVLKFSTIIFGRSICTVCDGQDAGVIVPGTTVEELLNNARSIFCGCQYVSKNIHLDFQLVGDIKVPLLEANFSFFHDIKEVNGYIFLSTPLVHQISFHKLRIIRGRESVPDAPGITLAVGGEILCFYPPLLTEISAGGVYFSDNGYNAALCNVVDGSNATGYGVHWDDILNDDDAIKTFNIVGCTGSCELLQIYLYVYIYIYMYVCMYTSTYT